MICHPTLSTYPELPQISSLDLGLYRLYMPDKQEFTDFNRWLWSTNNDLDKIWTDPIQLIQGVYISPIKPSLISQVKSEISIAGKSSNVESYYVLNEYERVSCGHISIPEHYGNFIDFDISCNIYLPYIGFRNLNISMFVGGDIYLDYYFNYLDGTCVAFVRAKRDTFNSIIEIFEGNIYSQLTLTSLSNLTLKSTMLNSTFSAVQAIANPLTAGAAALSTNPVGAAIATASALGSAAANVMTAKTDINSQGNIYANPAFLSVQIPFITFIRPIQAVSAGFKKDKGYVSNIYTQLKSLSGYTEILYINLSDIDCTQDERDRLYNILLSGFYI